MIHRKLLYFIILSAAAIVLISALFLSMGNSPPQHTYPGFQPGIWDQPVIESPDWWDGSDLAYPFMFSFSLTTSGGFERVYRTYYRPTFVLARGHTANIIIDLVSHSDSDTNISLSKILNLPEAVSVRLIPESVTLASNKNKTISLEITDNNPSRSVYNGKEINESESVGLLLNGDDWVIGQAFYLKFV
jgi:hypothetical protein